jgi:hypothetical protein
MLNEVGQVERDARREENLKNHIKEEKFVIAQ